MPNFKIIQNYPDSARVKMYGSQDAAVLTDTGGRVVVTAPAEGLSITPPTDGLLITSAGLAVNAQASTTDVTEILTNITDTTGSGSTNYNVLSTQTWTFGLYNDSRAANAQLTAKMQLSGDGDHWVDDGDAITLSIGDANYLVPGFFLKYARVFYAAVNGSSAVTLNIYFQGQTV